MISQSFAAAGVSATDLLLPGQRATYSIAGTYTGTIILERLLSNGLAFQPVPDVNGVTVSATSVLAAGTIINLRPEPLYLRFRSTGAMTGTAVCALTPVPVNVGAAVVGADFATAAAVQASVQMSEVIPIVVQTTLSFANLPLTVADAGAAGGVKLGTFPKGRLAYVGMVGSLGITTTSVLAATLHASAACTWGLGGSLGDTSLGNSGVGNLIASAAQNVPGAAAGGNALLNTSLNGTVTPFDLWLSIVVPTGTDIDADATVLVNGTVTFTWIKLGDF